MLRLCLALFLAVTLVQAATDGAPKRCPGGYDEGKQVEMGRYWYECRDGQLVPKGCMTDDKRRIDIWESYDSNKNYRMQCVVDPSGYLSFIYKSCVYDGIERQSGEAWQDDKYWYACKKEGDYLRVDVGGCMDKGRRVDINDKVIRGDFVYQCKRTATQTCSMCPVACMKNGRQYDIGQTFENGDYVFACTKDDSAPIKIKVVGCFSNQQRLKDGDRFFKDDVIYECAVRRDSADMRPVGCVQRDSNGALVERRLGCYWVEGREPFQYEMTCKYVEQGDTAVKVQSRCAYKVTNGAYTIEPGCFQIVDKTVVACKKDTTGNMALQVYQVDQIGELTGKGLRFC